MILLDTHILIWLDQGNTSLGSQTRETIDRALQSNLLAVSAITFWEASMLQRKGRIQLPEAQGWRIALLSMGLIEIPIDGKIGIYSNNLAEFHPDPADRFIVASAIQHNATLVTADQRILDWSGSLMRLDGRD
jgi:PIN domain nuclease of toxin-antitoxin system